LSRQALKEASFVDVKQFTRSDQDHYICAYNAQAAPFEWRQGEIKQQPLRDNAWRRASAVWAADGASKNRNKPAIARL
jgi:murein tripeptide amidase MpaA